MWCLELRQYLKNIFSLLPHRQSSSVSPLILLVLCSGLFINIVGVVKKDPLELQKTFLWDTPQLGTFPSAFLSVLLVFYLGQRCIVLAECSAWKERCNTRRMGKQEAGWVRKNRKQEEAAIRWPLLRAAINAVLLMLQFRLGWSSFSVSVVKQQRRVNSF